MHFPTTAYILLGMLSSQEMSGYDLKQQLDKSLYPCYDSPAKSQIYGELRRLTQEGWATATDVPQTHRPDKRLYRITPAGRAALQQWLISPDVESDSFKSPLLLRLFFGHLVPREILMTQLETRRQQLSEELSACEEEERRLRDQMQEPRGKAQRLHFFLTLRFHRDMLRAARQWTDEALEQLADWEESPSVRQAAGD
jgi:PadR family transcriptional regulator, regulatory protein AphA